MFFVRERRVKIIGILLLLNVSWISGELPSSSYLPPNRDDQSGKFLTAVPTGQNYNTNSAPIETSISLTTSEPFSYNPSSFGSDSGETRNPPSNTYGPPNSDNLSNNRIPSSIRGNNNNNNGNDFNRGGPVRNQQSPVGNNGYSYQQPSPPFQNSNAFGPGAGPSGGQNQPTAPTNPQQSSSFGSIGTSHGGQNYQPTGPTNSPQLNSFSPVGGQSYQSAGPTNSPSGISSSFFNSPSPSLSPTYGPPVNTSGSFGGGRGNAPVSSSNLPERKPAGLSPYTSPNSFMPSPNGPISGAGNSQGFPPGLPGLSTNYGPPSPLGSSFGSLPPFGGNFNPAFNPFGSGSGNAPLIPNRNQYPSSGPTNIPKGQPSNNFGAGGGAPQALYGAPTQNGFADNTNLPSRRPSNFGGIGSPQTSYNPPIPSIQTPSDGFSPQGNRNKGTFGPPSPTYGPPSPGSGSPSPTYGPPTNSFSVGSSPQSFRPQEFDRLSQQNNRPIDNFSTGYQNTSNAQSPPSQSYSAPISNGPNVGYNRGQTQDGPYPSSGRPFSTISSPNYNNFNSAPNPVRVSSPSQIPSHSSSPQTGYPQRVQNQPSFSPNFGSSPNQGNRTSYTAPSNIYQPPLQSFSGGNTPQSSYLPPSSNTFSNPSGSRFGTNGGYENSRPPSSSITPNSGFATSGGNYEASRSPNVISSSPIFGTSGINEGPKLPTNAIPSDGGFSISGSNYEAPRSPTNAIPSGSPSSPSSLSPLYGTPSTNSLNRGFSTANQQGYPGSPSPSGFGNISPTEASRPSNFNSPSPSYGPPTRDYTDALLGDYNNPTYPEPGNGFVSNTNSFGEFSNPDENTQSSGSPPSDQGTPAQSAYSGFSPNPSSIGESPSRLYGAPRPTDDFTNEPNSSLFTGTGSTNTETQPELNFGTNPASSYLPPNQSGGTAFNNDDVVPSTSYTLPSDQPNSSRPGTSNTVKNTHRNVGSDLITGASTSPFLPFKDDSSKPNVAPSRATYEKSQEVTSNDLGTSGYDSAKPAKYQFNYDVKGFGPEFSHQESRNGSTTSGSYGVVLPDGRKQVVDYEANQEGFHPKIRYEESPNNSLQQNNDQNQGYNYSSSISQTQNLSQPSTPNVDSFNNQGSSSNYPEAQQSYSSGPDYSLGTVANQGSYTSPYDSSSPQSGYPINNEGSASNFNTYSNQGTSPSNPDGFTLDSNPSSQFFDNRGYDYTPGGNSNNQATSFDSGYPSGPNFKPGTKQIPFFT